ncbi:FtsK/SpoIIIE domain-containing protein [Bacillus massiliglaciei]|uniref:FtsK/SpoIIIE domain-containing protein n=1 Tax=Bacillus massiliglaciei TaxID=1816693 RepID=UPI000B1B7079|nr:FtsK/SpoIIIE domain-containing protein [Bacillus massiliglaciei]
MKTWLAKQRVKASVMKVFRNGGIGIHYSYSSNSGIVYPSILCIRFNYSGMSLDVVFSLPTGMDPKEVLKKEYCFKQVFGERIDLKGDHKHFTLTVYTADSIKLLPYSFEKFEPFLKGSIPIICGKSSTGKTVAYDMVSHPHLLIAGETGSGKSTQLRSILTGLIQNLPSERLHLYLCDLKRSEFHVFRNIKHVQGVYVSPADILPMLLYLQEETRNRGDLLDSYEVAHIDDLPDPPPYIILCIDEVALLKKQKALLEVLEEISSIGRALGVFLILSMQRPDSKLLEGALKNNMTVRMGFKCADRINSKIIGTPGSEKLKGDGIMLLKLQGQEKLKEIQAPYLSIEEAKSILAPYKSPTNQKSFKQPEKDSEIIDAIFEVLD